MDRHHHRHRHQQEQHHHQHNEDDAESEEGQISPFGGGGGGGAMDHRHHRHSNHQQKHADGGGVVDDNNSMDDEDTTDSLDIKPPQAAGGGRYASRSTTDKLKKSSTSSSRDGGGGVERRKHSKEHRHKAAATMDEPRGVDYHHVSRSSSDAGRRSSRDNADIREHRSMGGGGGASSSSSISVHRRGIDSHLDVVRPGTQHRLDTHHREVDRDHHRVDRHHSTVEQPQRFNSADQYRGGVVPVYKERVEQRSDKHQQHIRISPEKSDAERALEDLRSRLLSKRNKFDAEKRAAAEHHGQPEASYRTEDHHHRHQHEHEPQQQLSQHRDVYVRSYEQVPPERRKDRSHQQANSDQQQRRHRTEISSSKRNIIDLVDSPEPYSQQHQTNYNHAQYDSRYPQQQQQYVKSTRSGRRTSDTSSNGGVNPAKSLVDDQPHSQSMIEDPELMARRSKLLDADRERERRKEVGRDELEARRVQRRRERDDAVQQQQQQQQQQQSNAVIDDDDSDDMIHDPDDVTPEQRATRRRGTAKSKRSRTHNAATESDRSAESVVHVSDDESGSDKSDTDDSDESSSSSNSNSDNDEDDDSDPDDGINVIVPTTTSSAAVVLAESDGEQPVTPPSFGELSKSERRHQQQQQQQQHHMHSDASRSPHSRTRSRSRSRHDSRSPRSRSRSRSRRSSRTRSRTRSRSHSPRRASSRRRNDSSRSPSAHSRTTLSRSRSPSRSRSHSPTETSRKRSRSPSSDYASASKRQSPAGAQPSPADSLSAAQQPAQPTTAEITAVEAAARSAVAQLPNYYPGVQGCRSVEEFQCLNRIEEGTYGVVYRARDKRTEEIVALKRLKMEKEKEGFPITSLREINTLLKGQHPNIVTVREIVVGSNMDKIFIVMDYVEHDLKSLMETMRHRKQSFLPGEVKCLTQQLLRAVGHLHDNWILHRDLKTSNLLLSHKGILKVGDFGLAREYGSPLKAYTSVVVTLWYRAPELLLCCKEYSHPIDMWSVGCIFAEFLAMGALFPGKSEVDQLSRIFKDLGTPNEKIWPGYSELPAVQKMTFTEYPVSHLRKKFAHLTSEQGLQLLQGLLTYDPKQRLSAEQGLRSAYFRELPLPIDPAMFPTWPAKSELGARKALAASPKPPSGGGQYKQLQAGEPAELLAGGGADGHDSRGGGGGGGGGASGGGGFVLNAGMGGGSVSMDGRMAHHAQQQVGGFTLRF